MLPLLGGFRGVKYSTAGTGAGRYALFPVGGFPGSKLTATATGAGRYVDRVALLVETALASFVSFCRRLDIHAFTKSGAKVREKTHIASTHRAPTRNASTRPYDEDKLSDVPPPGWGWDS